MSDGVTLYLTALIETALNTSDLQKKVKLAAVAALREEAK